MTMTTIRWADQRWTFRTNCPNATLVDRVCMSKYASGTVGL